MDLLVGEFQFRLNYYENDGSGNYDLQTGTDDPFSSIFCRFNTSPHLADVDGDGDLDLLVGDFDGMIKYFENDGSGNYNEQTGTSNPFDGIFNGSYNSSPQLVDVDSDGDLDLISGENNGMIVYFQNDGSGNYTQQTGTNNPFDGIDVGAVSSPQLVDVDGDDDLDLVVGNFGNTIDYFENDGSGNYSQQTGSNNPFNNIEDEFGRLTPQLVDVDGDGDLEMIAGNNYGTINYYENQPTCLPSNVNGFVDCAIDAFDIIDAEEYSSPQLIDIDDDGDLDLVSGSYFYGIGSGSAMPGSGTLLYYQNDGGNYAQQTDSDNPFANITIPSFNFSPQVVDLDDDGNLDLVTGVNFTGSGSILYYEGDSGGNFNEQTGTDNPFLNIVIERSTPQIIDVDGDGNLDLISGEDNGRINYFQNDGSGNFIEQTGTNNPFAGIDVGSASSPQLVDVDGDTDLDLIVGNRDGMIIYYQNDGSGTYIEQTGTNNPFAGIDVGRNATPQLVDVDGDGDLDLITGNQDGEIIYYQNANLSASASATEAACGGDGAEVELSVESDMEGPYAISNAFSGSIGMAGVIGAMETLMTDITEAGTYVFEVTAADGCAQVAAVVDIEAASEVDINSLSIDLLCEGVQPGTCPPIALDWEEPDGDIMKYQARITVLSTGEVFERMVLPPPLTVRPFLPPRIVGEEVSIEIAPILSDDSMCAFSEPRTFVVDCEDTDPFSINSIEDRSEEQEIPSSDLLLQPNPVQAVLNLTIIHEAEAEVKIQISDINGKTMLQAQFESSNPQHRQSIDISDLPTGIYLVRASVGGKELIVKQLVKI